jgi:hypothetical protein
MKCDLPLPENPEAKTITYHNTFIRNPRDCADDFFKKLSHGAHLRFLVIDPLSDTAKMRFKEIPEDRYKTLDAYQRKIRDYVEALQWVAKHAHEKAPSLDIDDVLQVHVYRDMPGIPIDLVQYENPNNDVVYHGLFLIFRNGSDDLPAAEFRRPSQGGDDAILFDELRYYVENKWKSSIPLKFSELSACLGGRPDDKRWFECIHDPHSHGGSTAAPASPAGQAARTSR